MAAGLGLDGGLAVLGDADGRERRKCRNGHDGRNLVGHRVVGEDGDGVLVAQRAQVDLGWRIDGIAVVRTVTDGDGLGALERPDVANLESRALAGAVREGNTRI